MQEALTKTIDITALLEEALSLPLNLYSAKNEQLFKSNKNQWFNLKAPADYLLYVEEPIALKIGRFDELYILVLLKDTSKLLLGPFLIHRTNEKEVLRNVLQTSNMVFEEEYYNAIEIFSFEQVQAKLEVLSEFLQVTLPSDWHWLKSYQLQYEKIAPPNPMIKENLRSSYLEEVKFYNAIRKGKTEEVYTRLKSFLASENLRVLSSNPVRSKKNQVIASITLAARFAIGGGLDEEIAFAISDYYIQKLETCYEMNSVHQLFLEAIQDFTERVRKNRVYYQYTTLTTQIIQWLMVDPNLSLTNIAEKMEHSTYYLSRMFKNDTGESFSSYKRKMMLERAVNLLVFSEKSVSAISMELGFNNVSYFSKVFKKTFHLSPREYRKNMHKYQKRKFLTENLNGETKSE